MGEKRRKEYQQVVKTHFFWLWNGNLIFFGTKFVSLVAHGNDWKTLNSQIRKVWQFFMFILCPTPPILCLQEPVDHLCHQFYWVWIKFLATYNRFVPNDFLMEISYLFMRKVQHVGIMCVFKVISNVLFNKLSNKILLCSWHLPLKTFKFFELLPCKTFDVTLIFDQKLVKFLQCSVSTHIVRMIESLN